ncbi:MAG: sulfate ABC transporter substrate-binding protein [Polyangiales bacterium]
MKSLPSLLRVARSHWLLLLLALLLAACESRKNTAERPVPEASASKGAQSITLGAYTTPREAYGRSILPAFRARWRERTGRDVEFRESYLGSGAQARAIIGGFEADVAALSLEPDIEKIREAGLIRHDWKAGEYGGMVTNSIVVIGVRENNPKNIHTWQDLARPGVEVLTPNVRTSGGAIWNVLAIYGAAIRGKAGVPAGDRNAAIDLLASILRNVRIMDKGARESMLTFERGVGDAVIAYENEILVGRAEGKRYEYVAPSSTILIENPVAIVDVNVEHHGAREVAQAFLDFLWTPDTQRSYAKHGLRPVVQSVASEVQGQFASVDDLFTIRDLGDWAEAQRLLFDQGGVYDQALEGSRKDRR